MQIQIEEKEPCQVQVTYVAEPEKVISLRSEVIHDLATQVANQKFAGYRKGKAPLEAVKLRFRKEIELETQRRVLALAEQEVKFETKLKTMFSPQVLSLDLKDSRFECQFLFLTKPIVELKEYKGLEIPKPHVSKTIGELVEAMLEQIRKECGNVVPYGENDFVEMGDKITMDILIKNHQDANLPTIEGNLFTVAYGDYRFPSEFVDNILGMKAGEERSFKINVESDPYTFTVKVHMGTKTVPAPLDDSLAVRLGEENFEALRTKVESTATNQLQQHEAELLKEQVFARLLSSHAVEIPDWLTNLDAQQYAAQRQLKLNEVDETTRKALIDTSRDRVKLTLIMDAIRENEPELQLSNNELFDLVKAKIAMRGLDPEKFLVEPANQGAVMGLVAGVQQEHAVQWLINQSKIVE